MEETEALDRSASLAQKKNKTLPPSIWPSISAGDKVVGQVADANTQLEA